MRRARKPRAGLIPIPPLTTSPLHLFPSSPVPLFNPDETTAAAIIDDFAGQDENLRGIALKYDTTLESLTLWLARPDIKERIFALESACAARARLVVANNLAAIANKLLHLLDESKLDHESIHRVPVATPHAFAARMQSRESARKTANLLLRIARYVPSANPTPHAPPPNTNPTRKRGATAAHPAQQTPEDQQHPPAPPLPAQRGEDRLAKGQAGEGTETHLNAHAVQYKAAAPNTNPTRKRGATAAYLAPQTPEVQQHLIAPPLPATRGEDSLAKDQAPYQASEWTDAHLNAHAVQHTPAAPTTTPTRHTRPP